MQIDFSYFNPYVLFIIGSLILYYSSELIISNSLSIANKYNISKITVGIIALALGTSLPELFVSIIALAKGNDSIVVGNIIGSNIANIGLVLGICILVKPFSIESKKNISFNIISLFIITIVFLLLLFNNDLLRLESGTLLILFLIYIYMLIKYFSKDVHSDESDNKKIFKTFLLLVFGFFMIYVGSEVFINGALGIAHKLGLNDLIVGMTIVAIGTSCPELFTTLIAIKRNEHQLALGNIVGSNIINILIVGGFLSFLTDVKFQFDNIYYHSLILLILTILLLISVLFIKKINRFIGIVFISIYFLFIFINF